MHPEVDEADVLAMLEVRLEKFTGAIRRLQERNTELTAALDDARGERDRALQEAKQARKQAVEAADELEAVRARQQQAFARVKALVAQIEQLESGGEG